MSVTPRPGPQTAATMAIPNGYTAEEGQRLSHDSRQCSRPHLICALDFVVKFFQGKGISVALMGGLALNFRGFPRDTTDVDIVVDCDMRMLRQCCIGEERMRIPTGPTSGAMRVFVHVGPRYGEGVGDRWVQVDFTLTGSLGAPQTLSGTTETVRIGPKRYTIIDLRRQFQSKLGAYFHSGKTSDYEDLIFMCTAFPSQVWWCSDSLDLRQRMRFMDRYARENQGSENESLVQKMKILLKLP